MKIYEYWSSYEVKIILIIANNVVEAKEELKKYYYNYKKYLFYDGYEFDEDEINWINREIDSFKLKSEHDIKVGEFFHYFE